MPNTDASPFSWKRTGDGYEVSSAGDRRFSAFTAKMPDGRTIEVHYQCEVKGYCPGGTLWRLGKGKPPLDTTKNLWEDYLSLWRTWAKSHDTLLEELYHSAALMHYTLLDRFATTPINQARALSVLLNELHQQKLQTL